MEEQTIRSSEKTRICGWLLLPALFFVTQPISIFYKTFKVVNEMGPNEHLAIIKPAVIADSLILIGLVITAYLFFSKKKMAPGMFVVLALYIYFVWNMIDAFSQIFYSPIIANLFICLVFIPYFVYSKRVQRTFINPLKSTHMLDRWYVPIESAIIGFYSFLRRHRPWLFPGIILYLFIVTLLYAFLRAVFVLGDVGQTFDLLL